VELVRRAGRGVPAALVALALLLAGGALSYRRVDMGVQEMRIAVEAAALQHGLTRLIALSGGRAAILACGSVAVNHTAHTALAWKLKVPLDRVAEQLRKPGVVLVGPSGSTLGSPAAIALRRPWREVSLASTGAWRAKAVVPGGAPLPRGCGPGA